jgi:hypothetical protein
MPPAASHDKFENKVIDLVEEFNLEGVLEDCFSFQFHREVLANKYHVKYGAYFSRDCSNLSQKDKMIY